MRRNKAASAVALALASVPGLVFGQTEVLSDSSAIVGQHWAELFEIDVPAGGTWVMLTSAAFDTLLLIVDAEGDVSLNDDHASGDMRLGLRDSAILLDEPGRYVVIATSYGNSGRGEFGLLLPEGVAFRPVEAGSVAAEIASAAEHLTYGEVETASTSESAEFVFAEQQAMSGGETAAAGGEQQTAQGSTGAGLPDESLAQGEPVVTVRDGAPDISFSQGEPVVAAEGPRLGGAGVRPVMAPRTSTDPCGDQPESGEETAGAELEQIFPWPPPNATDRLDLSRSYFADATTLGEVADTLTAALTENGYSGSGFWGVEDTGFAIATRMEQTDHEARALAGSRRFAAGIAHLKRWSLEALVRSMVLAEPGYYRTIVFIVTDLHFSEAPRDCTQDVVERWANTGQNRLPREVEALPFSVHHRVTALIYEFSKSRNGETPGVNTRPLNGAVVHLSEIRRTLGAR